MKHIEAGLIVGAGTLGLVLIIALAWRVLTFAFGDEVIAAGALLAVAIIATMVVVIDWATERKGA